MLCNETVAGYFYIWGRGVGGGGATIRLPTTCLGQQNCKTIVRRIMTSYYHGSKISGSQQPFLIETAICTVERWKESMGYRFGTGCNHAQENHTCQFLLFFFLPHLFRSRNWSEQSKKGLGRGCKRRVKLGRDAFLFVHSSRQRLTLRRGSSSLERAFFLRKNPMFCSLHLARYAVLFHAPL